MEKQPAGTVSHHLRLGQPSGRATGPSLAKPEALLSTTFTATLRTTPLHVASFTCPAFQESFGFGVFLGNCFSSSKRYILPCNVT